MDVNQLFPWFSTRSDALNEGQIISNDDGFLNYFIKIKDYIVKTTRSLRAE